ncbi:hypothetical protein Ae707Ps1_6290 [Pseudonocardia sp. Ae707_Ps1]|nr:hypothetical protein Ae707Ps1_6290 [Pseudonocardia sp. Ae707_Ps1]
MGFLWDIHGVGGGPGLLGGRARATTYPPHVWAGYGGCRSVRAFEASVWVEKSDRAMAGRPALTYEAGLRDPVVDALNYICDRREYQSWLSLIIFHSCPGYTE